MEHQPIYKKFGANSPQFADVGKAMFAIWFAEHSFAKKRDFSTDDIEYLLQWMWHELKAKDSIIRDNEKKISELNKLIKGDKKYAKTQCRRP